MKITTTAAMLCVIGHQASYGQRSAEPVARQRAAYQLIEKNLNTYHSVQASREELNLEQRSLEGGWLQAYCDGPQVKKIFAEDDGETYTGTTSFYYDHDSLLFVFVRNGRGHMSDSSGPYPKRTEFEEERFYFADGKLIRWLGNDGKPQDITTRTSERRGADMFAEGERYYDLMAGCAPKTARSEAPIDEDVAYTLASIRMAYQRIESSLPRYRHLQARTEAPGTVDAYCSQNDLRLLVLDYKAANDARSEWYYFTRGSLFFVYRTSHSGTAAEEERFYFDEGKLIRWLGARDAPHDPNSADARNAADRLSADAAKYRKLMPWCRGG